MTDLGHRCLVPGCRYRLKGMTGFQEVENLRKHFKRAHLVCISMERALEVREQIERGASARLAPAHD